MGVDHIIDIAAGADSSRDLQSWLAVDSSEDSPRTLILSYTLRASGCSARYLFCSDAIRPIRRVRHVRLLVIEDEPRIAEILKSGLRRAGFIVDVVHLCAEAREALAL